MRGMVLAGLLTAWAAGAQAQALRPDYDLSRSVATRSAPGEGRLSLARHEEFVLRGAERPMILLLELDRPFQLRTDAPGRNVLRLERGVAFRVEGRREAGALRLPFVVETGLGETLYRVRIFDPGRRPGLWGQMEAEARALAALDRR